MPRRPDRGLEPLLHEALRLKNVHQTDRAFKGDGVEGDKGLLARIGLTVLENRLLMVDKKVSALIGGVGHGWYLCPPVDWVFHDGAPLRPCSNQLWWLMNVWILIRSIVTIDCI
jgi:hypothetical protein